MTFADRGNSSFAGLCFHRRCGGRAFLKGESALGLVTGCRALILTPGRCPGIPPVQISAVQRSRVRDLRNRRRCSKSAQHLMLTLVVVEHFAEHRQTWW